MRPAHMRKEKVSLSCVHTLHVLTAQVDNPASMRDRRRRNFIHQTEVFPAGTRFMLSTITEVSRIDGTEETDVRYGIDLIGVDFAYIEATPLVHAFRENSRQIEPENTEDILALRFGVNINDRTPRLLLQHLIDTGVVTLDQIAVAADGLHAKWNAEASQAEGEAHPLPAPTDSNRSITR